MEESHPAIIEKEMWEAVQLEMERKRAFAENHGIVQVDYATIDNPFAGRVIWRCNNKYVVKGCGNKHIKVFNLDSSASLERIPLLASEMLSEKAMCASSASYTVFFRVHL